MWPWRWHFWLGPSHHNSQSYRNRVYSDELSAPDCNIVAPPPCRVTTRRRKQHRARVSRTERSDRQAQSSDEERGPGQRPVPRSRPEPTARTLSREPSGGALRSDRKAAGGSVRLGFVRLDSGCIRKTLFFSIPFFSGFPQMERQTKIGRHFSYFFQ